MLDDSPGAVYDDRRIDMLFFKKINAGLSLKLIFSGLAALTLFSTFSSCHIYNLSLEDFLKEWTETARVAESRISPEPVYKDSYAHIASGEDTLITYKLVNPQNYDLDESLSWETGISPASGTDYYLEQDANDKNILYLTLKKDFLEGLDGTGTKISPSLTLKERKSGRIFGTYSVPALVNSAPPAVIHPVVLCTGGTVGDETYVICFNLPEMTGIHQDVKTLKISSPYERTYTVTPEGNLSGGEAELTEIYGDTWKPVTENGAGFTGDKNNRFVGIVTDVLLSDNLTTFTLTLTDSSGLSTPVKVSTQAPKLDSVTASPKGGTIKTDGTVTFTSPVAGAGIVLTSNNWAGVKNGEEQVSGVQVTGTDSITLTFTKPGTYNITAYAQMSGAADSDKVIFTYKVVDDSAVYVSNTGNDNNPGTEDKPVATLQRALDLLNEARFTEGKIVVTGTVQTEEVKINAPGGSTTGSVTTLTVMGGSGSAGGTLKNEKGRVFNITGGSVTLGDGITLTGTVTGENARGGAVYVTGGNFTMESGSTIADSSVQGTSASGGGVYVMNGTFIMEDGSKITGSSATVSGGGVYVCNGGSFTMTGGTIGGSDVNDANKDKIGGGGVFVNGKFTMSGGTITGNTTGANGGGVAVAEHGTFTMSGTAAISANKASNGSGGGVYVFGNFTMTGGTIGGPEAGSTNTAQYGGGVYVWDGTFTMNGGIITGNTATQNGGGVYVSSTGSFTLGSSSTVASSPVVSGNTKTGDSTNNVYLDTGKTLSITGELKKAGGSGNIGISMATPGVFTSGWSTSGSTEPTFFFSDDTERTVALSGSELSLNLVFVEGGSYELNSQSVTLSDFWISPYEVTQKEFETIMTGNLNSIEPKPSSFTGNTAAEEVQERRPVDTVRWFEAIVYCNLLSMKEGLTPCYTIKDSTNPADWGVRPDSGVHDNYNVWNSVTCDFEADGYRLPTEAEWEYAARGGKPGKTDSSWNNTYSGSDTINEVAWYSSNSGSKTHEVGKKQANALRLYDMSGNLKEWCWNRKSEDVDSRVMGGGYYSSAEGDCQVTAFDSNLPISQGPDQGFRVVRSIR